MAESENVRIVALPDVIEKPNALGVERERVADSPEKFGAYRALGRHHPQVKPEGSTEMGPVTLQDLPMNVMVDRCASQQNAVLHF